MRLSAKIATNPELLGFELPGADVDALVAAQMTWEYSRAILAAEPLDGEQWHPSYENNDPTGFKLMVTATVKTDREFLKALRWQAKNQDQLIDYGLYEIRRQSIQAAEGDDLLLPDDSPGWKKVFDRMFGAYRIGIEPSIVAGGQYAEKETGVGIGWSSGEPAAQKFIRKYGFGLVKNLNKTTRERMRQALLTGLQDGADQAAMTKRLTPIIADPRRSSTIANTEVVRAYNEGRDEAMKQTGLKYTWRWLDDQPDSCKICRELHGTIANKSGNNQHKFYSATLGDYIAGPPAHPNCRCNKSAIVL